MSTEAVNWSRREKGKFATLGVDLFGRGGDADAHAREHAQHECDPCCAWCGARLEDCIKGRGASCGFAIEA